jgi:hypothetical protein
MSWEMIRYVRDDVHLPYAEKAVLLVIATYVCPHGYAWPSIPTLARGVGMTERGVQKLLRTLREKKLLHVCEPQRSGKGNRYVILTPEHHSGLHICTPEHRCRVPPNSVRGNPYRTLEEEKEALQRWLPKIWATLGGEEPSPP